MDKMEFMPNEIAILNEKANKGLPMRTGECVIVLRKITSPNYDYECEFNDGSINPVRECELNKFTEDDKQYMEYIYQGNKVLYWFDAVTIQKVDYLHKKAEIKFGDTSSLVVDFEKLLPITQHEQVINSLEDTRIDIYEDLLNILFKHYKNQDSTYTIPKELLVNMLEGLYMEGE